MNQDKGNVERFSDHSRYQPGTVFSGLEQTSGAPKLWFAVLAQAFRDFDGNILSQGSASNRKINYCRRTAKAWFLSNSPAMGGFKWIAELFDLDAQAVRKQLLSGKRIALNESLSQCA